MGYDSKGILVFNLKYEHVWSNLLSNVNIIVIAYGEASRFCYLE